MEEGFEKSARQRRQRTQTLGSCLCTCLFITISTMCSIEIQVDFYFCCCFFFPSPLKRSIDHIQNNTLCCGEEMIFSAEQICSGTIFTNCQMPQGRIEEFNCLQMETISPASLSGWTEDV